MPGTEMVLTHDEEYIIIRYRAVLPRGFFSFKGEVHKGQLSSFVVEEKFKPQEDIAANRLKD